MKIVEYSKGSITEVENVFKVVESGAQGPQGAPGTIGTLDLLDPKATPVDADLMLVGDSADSFANKATTWANIKATIKAFFDPLYAAIGHTIVSHDTTATGANLTELTDGSETALHSHAGGGGGGGIYEVVESRAMTGKLTELFTIGTNDNILFLFAEVSLTGVSGEIEGALSLDNGVTYPSTHNHTGSESRIITTTYDSAAATNQPKIGLSGFSINKHFNGSLEVMGVTDAAEFTSYRSSAGGYDSNTNRWVESKLQGGLQTVGVPNLAKFSSLTGGTLSGGIIHHLKRLI